MGTQLDGFFNETDAEDGDTPRLGGARDVQGAVPERIGAEIDEDPRRRCEVDKRVDVRSTRGKVDGARCLTQLGGGPSSRFRHPVVSPGRQLRAFAPRRQIMARRPGRAALRCRPGGRIWRGSRCLGAQQCVSGAVREASPLTRTYDADIL